MKTSILTVALVLVATAIRPAPFTRPQAKNGEKTSYKATIDGKGGENTAWAAQMSYRYEPVEWAGHIKVSGDTIIWTRTEKLTGGGRRVMEGTISAGANMKVVKWTDTFYASSGKVETKTEQDFTDPALKYPDDMIPMFMLPFMLRGMDLENKVEHKLKLWHNPMSFSRGTWKSMGKESVSVPAGEFECYKVEMTILIDDDNIVAKALQRVIPKFYYHLNVEEPHQLVKFSLNLPGRGNMKHELVSYSEGN